MRRLGLPAAIISFVVTLLITPRIAGAKPVLNAFTKDEGDAGTRVGVYYTVDPNGTDLSLGEQLFKNDVVKKKQSYRLPVDVTKTWHYNDGLDKKKPRTGSGTLHDEVEIPARDRYDLNLSVYLIPNQGLTGPCPGDPVSVSGKITYPNDSPADGFGTEQLSYEQVGAKTWDIYRDGHYDFSSLRVRDIHGGTSSAGTGRMLQDYMGDVTVGDSDAYVAAFLGQHAGDADSSQPPITQIVVTPVIRESYGEQNVYEFSNIDMSYDHLKVFQNLYHTLKLHSAMQQVVDGDYGYSQSRRMSAYNNFLETGSYANASGDMDCSSLVWQLTKYAYDMKPGTYYATHDGNAPTTWEDMKWLVDENGWGSTDVSGMSEEQLHQELNKHPDSVVLYTDSRTGYKYDHVGIYDAPSGLIYEAVYDYDGQPLDKPAENKHHGNEQWDKNADGRLYGVPTDTSESGKKTDEVVADEFRQKVHFSSKLNQKWRYIIYPADGMKDEDADDTISVLADIYADSCESDDTSAFVLSEAKSAPLETSDMSPEESDAAERLAKRLEEAERDRQREEKESEDVVAKLPKSPYDRMEESSDLKVGLGGEKLTESGTRDEMEFVYAMNQAVAQRVRDALGDDKPVDVPENPPASVSTTCEGRTIVDAKASLAVPVGLGDRIDVSYAPTEGYTIDGRRVWHIGVGIDPAPTPAIRERLCNVVFDPNGDANRIWDTPVTGTMRSEDNVHYWTGAYLPKCGFRREHYDFMGWATKKDGNVVYKDGDFVQKLTHADGATVTLYAVWRPWTRFNLDLTCDHDVSDNYDIPSWQARQAFHAGDNGWYNLTGAVYGVSGNNGMSDDIIVSESVTDDKSGENQIGRGFVYVPSDADYEIRLTRTPRKAIGGGIGEATDSAIPSGYVNGEDIGTRGVRIHAGGAFPYDKKEDFDKYGADTMLPDTARIRIARRSAIPEKTAGNGNYDLAGGTYRVSQLWKDEDGYMRTVAVREARPDLMSRDRQLSLTDDVAYLKYGTYDVCEVSNSRGYEYDLDSDNAPRHWNVTVGGSGSGGIISRDGKHSDVIAEPDTYVRHHAVDRTGRSAGQGGLVVFSPRPYLIDVQADVLSDDPDYTADYDGTRNPNYDLAAARYRLTPYGRSWFKGADGAAVTALTDAVREERAQDARELHDARLDNVAVSYDSAKMTSRTSGEKGTRQRKATVTWRDLPLGTYTLTQTSPAKGFNADASSYRLNATSTPDAGKVSRWTLATSYAKSGDNGTLHDDGEPDAGFVAPSVRGPWFLPGQRETAGKVKLSDASPDSRHAYVLRSYNVPKTGTLRIDAGVDADRGNAVDVRGGNDAVSTRGEDIANQAWFGVYYDKGCKDLLGIVNRSGEFADWRTGDYGRGVGYQTLTRIPFPVGSYYVRMLTAPLNYDIDPKVYEIDLDEDHGDVVMRLDGSGAVRSIGYLKAARHSESPKTTETNANYDLTGAIYGVYDDAAAAHRAARAVMDKRRSAQDEASKMQGRLISPDDGYAVTSGGRVLSDRMDLERVPMSDVSDHLADVLASMTVDDGGTVARSDDTKETHYASRAWLKRGVADKSGTIDEDATGDYSIRTGDYYVTEIAASKGYDPVEDGELPIGALRVTRRIDPKNGRVVAEIGGWRYELTGDAESDVYVGLALESSDDGMVERPVAVSMDEGAVSMRRTRIAEGDGRHVEESAASEEDGRPLVVENEVGKWYVSGIPGVRADEYLPDLAATGTTLVESDTKDGYGVTHEEAARRVIASIPSVGYGRKVGEDHTPGDAVTERLDFEAKLRPFPVYVRYIMSSGSALTQDDVVLGTLGASVAPANTRDSDRVFNARYSGEETLSAAIRRGDGNAFRADSNETGARTARVMPLEWPVSDRRDEKWHERWDDRPYQVAVRITDADDDGYDAFTERDYPRAWAWRRVMGGAKARYESDGGLAQSDIGVKPYAYVPSWLSSYDSEKDATQVAADPNEDATRVRFDLTNGIDDVKDRNAERGIYPDLRATEALDDWYPTDGDGSVDMSRVVPVYENYIEVVNEGVSTK